MSYRLIVLSSAERDIRKLPRGLQARVTVRVNALKTNPRPHDVKKLEGSDEYRIRVGDYRIVFTIDDVVVTVTVVRVGHRREIYR